MVGGGLEGQSSRICKWARVKWDNVKRGEAG